MNRIYKTVFNKSTQTWVAVCEYARGAGCGGASSTSKSVARDVCGSITFLSFAVLMALQLAHAGTPTTIIADPSAPKSLQPIILPTASGITSVNIATPNDKGLSNNHYSQFDVGSTGAVLNNNRKAVGTQIAGFVAANPFMARGEASTILNQINSSNPSYLNGFVEVAGKKADVIIANPNGLIINGAGFINAGNVHLAAANAQVKQGQLSAYQVGNSDTGNIQVNGKLNLQNTNYAALIAKTAQINDEIYAGNQLDVILGENTASIQDGDLTQLTAINKQASTSTANQATSQEQQGVALDIAALGGMYAGKIHLVGTNKGFGVNNQGVITATGKGVQAGIGTLSLDIKGNLVNAGTMSTKDKLAINTHGNTIQNNGTLLSEQADIAISTKELVNIGTIHSTQITNMNADKSIDNQGGIYGGVLQISADKLTNTGNFIQTGTGRLNISTDHLNNTNKAIIGQSLYGQTTIPTPSAPSSSQSAGTIGNQPINNTATTHSNNSTNTPHSSSNTSSTDGFMNVAKSLNNTGDKALITGAGNISITANKTHNTHQSSIDATSLNTNTLTNTDSKIALDEINWQLTSFDNSKGSVTARNGMVIDSGSDIINTGGNLASGGDMALVAKDKIVNQDGTIIAVKQANITAQELQNAGTITADTLNIAQETDYIHTNQDKLIANHLTLTTDGKLINQSQLTAGHDLTLNAKHIDNTQAGIITSGNHTQITSQTDITNQGLINGENTRIKATNTINNQAFGRIYGTHLAIQADTLNNTPSKITNPQTNQENTQHTAPVIAAKERLDIGVNTLNNNPNPDRAGKFNENFDSQALITSLGSLHIGGSLDDNHHATGKAQTVVNKGATIESGRQMQIATNTLLNTNADFKKHTVKVEAESVYGQTLYRNREQSGVPATQKSTNIADLGKKPMAGLFDCPEGSNCIINYDNDSAIWSYFKIEPPKQPVPNIKAKDLLDEPDLPKNETAQSCALAPASNQACIQYNEALAQYTKVVGPLLKWEEDNAASIEALGLAIREYNRQFNKNKSDVDLALNIYTTDEAYLGPTSRKGAPTGALYVKQENGSYHRVGEEIDEITVDFVVYEDKTLASDPARMVAGGDLIIHGDTLINDKSQMNAGNGFAVVGDTVIQTPDNGLYGEKTKVTENGRYVSRTVESSRAGTRHKRVDISSGSFVQSFAPLATYQLPILNATINTTPSNISIDKTIAGDKSSSVIIDVNGHDDTISLPNSALYIINADDPNLPLVQTDPAFTNYKQWLSSDYMLKALQSDPNHIHKRLSDGYGEQERIKDQYYLLTGRHINTDYSSNEEAFKTLMDNGITYAKAFGYTLGTALTPEQMASLTTDIVWLVKQPMTYTTKDNHGNTITKTQDVLVPKLYLRSANVNTGTLTKDGRYSGISGRSVNMQLTDHLDNNGNLIAKDATSIKASNATNKGVIQGDFVAVTTSHDLTNQGTMYANSAMSLDAGNNLTNQSQTITQTNTQGKSSSSRTDISQIATISVGAGLKDKTDDNGKPLTTLSLRGNQIIYQGATSDNAGGSTQMTAKNGIDITTLTTSNHINAVADENNYFKYNQTTDVGSNITSHGNLTIATTGKEADINIKGSHLDSATGTNAVIGTGDVRMSEGRQTERVESASLHTNRRLTGSKTERSSFGQYSDKSLISQVGGNQVVIQGVNTTLMATEVLAGDDIHIKADKNLVVGSAKDSLSEHNSKEVTKKGIFTTAPTSVTLGKQQTHQKNSHEQTTYTGSLIGTTGGNVSLVSNGSLAITNSDIIAQKDEINANTGNIYIQATDATIQGQNTISNNNHHFSQKTTGITASISSSVVSDVQSVENLKESIKDTDSRRAKLMGGLVAASKVKTLANNLNNKDLGSLRVQATIGSQSTKSDSHSYQETNDAANIHADNNLIINLTGKGNDSNLTVVGSNITVGNNLYQNIEGNVAYQASTQTNTSNSQNSSKGWGAGVYASTQPSNGQKSAGFTANANKAKGSSTETTTTHTNTQVNVGGTTYNDIGGNLTLDGANLNTNHLTGTIGKDLIVKSRQDTHQYTHNQKQIGFSADVGFDGTPQSINVNGGKTDVDADYAQVTHQSGITAKESTLMVQGQGNFTGGYLITDADKNQTQFAQGIKTQDIQNHLDYQGNAINIGVGINRQANKTQEQTNQDGQNKTTYKPALQGLGYGKIDPVHKTSATHSAITDQAGLSHINTENFKQAEVQNQLNEIIANEFNGEKVLKELNAQVNITQAFDAERRAIRTEYAKKAEDYRTKAKDLPENDPTKTELVQEAQKIEQKLRLFDGITSALYAPNTNGILGDTARALSPELAYQIGQYFKENKVKNQQDNGNRPEEQSLQHLMAHAILGAATSYATGNNIATGALSGATSEKTAPILASYLYGKDPKELSQEQKDTITSIISLGTAGMAYGATGDVGSAVSASEVGKGGVENNYYYPNLSKINTAKPEDVRRLYNNQISYFDGKCNKAGGDCNYVIDNMLKFVDNAYVRQHYPDLYQKTLEKLRDNPDLIESYFISLQAQFNAKDNSILNKYIQPTTEMLVGGAGMVGSVTGTGYACMQTVGLGCYAAVLAGSLGYTSSVSHLQSGYDNFGKPLSQQSPNAFVSYLKSKGLSEQAAQNIQMAVDVFGTGGVGRAVGGVTSLQGATSGKPIIASGNSVQKIIFNGIELHPSLPPPIAGYNYQPHKLNGRTTAQQNAHINGYKAEIEQANRVAAIPNEQVIKWGDKIGNHGADIISVNRITGNVTLWDSKYRSATTNINTSPTFTNPSALRSAKNEAIEAIEESNLPQSTKNLAISNIVNNNISFKTTGAGNARNSVID